MPYYTRGSSLTRPVFPTFLVCIFSIVHDLIYCFVSLAWPRCAVCAKSAAAHGKALGLHVHSLSLTDSPRATSSPAGSARGKCPIRACQFFSFIPYFAVRFPCLDTQIPYCYNCSAAYRMSCRLVAQERVVLSCS